ncbi:MAG: hypothetical protein AB7U24_05085 [Sulfurimonadaceae bacterium]
MLREIIKPTSELYSIHIPKEYLNRDVEILVLPFSYNEKHITENEHTEDIFAKTSGILKSRSIDPLQWQEDIRSDREF